MTNKDWYEEFQSLIELSLFDDAIKHCKKRVELEPNLTEAWYALSISYSKNGNEIEAMSAINKCLEIEPNNAYANSNKGALYCIQKEYEKGIPYFEKAFELDSEDPEILLRLGDCYIKAQKYDKIQEVLEKLYLINEDMALTLEGMMIRDIVPERKNKINWFTRLFGRD